MYHFQQFMPIRPFVPVTIPMSIQMNNDMYQMMMLHWAYNMGIMMYQQTTTYPLSVQQPPQEPQEGDCCGSGCVRCVWDIYYEKLERYNEQRLRTVQQPTYPSPLSYIRDERYYF